MPIKGRTDGEDIGLDKRFSYFRYRPAGATAISKLRGAVEMFVAWD